MSPASQHASKRLLILASKLGYQTRNFAQAAQKLSVEVVFGTDRCHQLDDPWADGALALHFEQPEQAAERIVEQARAHPIRSEERRVGKGCRDRLGAGRGGEKKR